MRYFVAFLIAIGLIVLVFVLFLTGGSGSKSPKASTTSLSSYANTATEVRVTIDGAVTADQNHRAIQVTVGANQNTIEILQGYEGSVAAQASYPNNSNAYSTFLSALDLAGFTKARSTSQTNDSGVCPLGQRYVFEIINGAQTKQNLWATSCGGQGTFGGSLPIALDLFEQQIPGYNAFTNNVNLAGSD